MLLIQIYLFHYFYTRRAIN